MALDIQNAYNLVIQACNDPNIGYSQSDRYTIELGKSYRTYADCSSLIAWAIRHSGEPDCEWFWTGNQLGIMIGVGFVDLDPTNVEWRPGDVLMRHNAVSQHTEMVYQGTGIGRGITMGAHASHDDLGNEIPFPDQVSIRSGEDVGSNWEHLLRYGGGAVFEAEWTQVETEQLNALTEQQVYTNSALFYDYLSRKGWSDIAIAGMLGNITIEGQMNPAQWESGYHMIPTSGYGFFGYTPSTKYRVDYAPYHNIDFNDARSNAEGQIEYMLAHPEDMTMTYPGGYEQFNRLTTTDETAYVWCYHWERPFNPAATIAARQAHAAYWLEEIKKGFPTVPRRYGGTHWIYGAIHNMRRRKFLFM